METASGEWQEKSGEEQRMGCGEWGVAGRQGAGC